MTAMNPDRHSKQVHEPGAARTGRRRQAHGVAQNETSTAPSGLAIKSLGRTMTEAQALGSADLLVLLGEDCCWQAATEHWRLRRPALWRFGARRAWRAEGRVLRDKSRRLRDLGAELGLAPAKRAGLRSWFGRAHH